MCLKLNNSGHQILTLTESLQKTVGQQGRAPCPHTTDVFWRKALPLQEGMLACCLVFLGLLLLFLNRKLVALSPCNAKITLPREAHGPGLDCILQKHRLPSSAKKMEGKAWGVQQTAFLSSAAAYSCCTISMKHVESNFYPIPVKPCFGPFFQYINKP